MPRADVTKVNGPGNTVATAPWNAAVLNMFVAEVRPDTVNPLKSAFPTNVADRKAPTAEPVSATLDDVVKVDDSVAPANRLDGPVNEPPTIETAPANVVL